MKSFIPINIAPMLYRPELTVPPTPSKKVSVSGQNVPYTAVVVESQVKHLVEL